MMLFIAPHSDDIALSLGGTVAGLAPWKGQAKVLTVFSRSLYAPHAEVVQLEDVSILRLEEDREYCAAYGMEHEHLNLPDSSCIGLDDTSELQSDWRQDSRLEHVTQALLAKVTEAQLIYAPMGLGNHIDHVLVRQILLDQETLPVIWYEDIPYAFEFEPAEPNWCRAHLREGGLHGLAIQDISQKIYAISYFRSQISSELAHHVIDFALHIGVDAPLERVWINWRRTAINYLQQLGLSFIPLSAQGTPNT